MKIILIITILLFLSACSNIMSSIKSGAESVANATSVFLPDGYTKDYSQGNSISEEQIKELKIGMSKFQVRQLLGSPTIDDPFRKNRWDYIDNSIIKGERVFSQLTLFFNKDNRLVEIMPTIKK